MRDMKSNDFRNYTIGEIEKICEERDECENCPARIVCDCLSNMQISWEYSIKCAERKLKMEE